MAERDDIDPGDKPFDPSPRKLEEARRKGEIPRSTEVVTASAYLGVLLVALAWGATGLVALGSLGVALLADADRLGALMLAGSTPVAGALLGGAGLALAPFFLVPPLVALAALIVLRALVFTPSKLKPKPSRLSIIANARNKFGRSGLFEFAKSLAKLLVIGGMLWLFLLWRLPQMTGAAALSPGLAVATLLRLMVEFLALVVLLLGSLGAIDLLWQWREHLRRHRMTHKEMRDELKSAEGDPQLKARRRQKGMDIATNRMLADVPGADVVIVNPTHYAVALRWDRTAPQAPVCVAKGVDAVAARIREAAQAAGVPIHADAATARALHATVGIGDEIRADHYAAVAVAIRFAEAMRARSRWRDGAGGGGK